MAGEQARPGGQFKYDCEKSRAQTEARFRMYQSHELALKYVRTRSRTDWLNLVGADLAHDQLREVVDAIKGCCPPNKRCQQLECPVCGRRHHAKEGLKALKKLFAKIGCMPASDEVSFVTVMGPRDQLENRCIRNVVREFRKRLSKFRGRRLPTTTWVGYIELTLEGRVHYHALVHHPDQAMSALLGLLRVEFPGCRDVEGSEWRRGRRLFSSIERTVKYSAKPLPRIRVRAEPDESNVQIPRLIGLSHSCAAKDR